MTCIFNPVTLTLPCTLWQPQFDCTACAPCTFHATFQGTEGQRLATYTPELGTLTVLGTGGIITEPFGGFWAFRPDTGIGNGFKTAGLVDLDLYIRVSESRKTELKLRSGAQSVQVDLEPARIVIRDLDGTELANVAFANTQFLDLNLSLVGTGLTYDVKDSNTQAGLASGSVTVTASTDTDVEIIVDNPGDPVGLLFEMHVCSPGVTPPSP